MRGNDETGTDTEGEVYIGRASFRMTPVGRDAAIADAQVTSVLLTGPRPDAVGITAGATGNPAAPEGPNIVPSPTSAAVAEPAVATPAVAMIEREAEAAPQTPDVAASSIIPEPAAAKTEHAIETQGLPEAPDVAARGAEVGAVGITDPAGSGGPFPEATVTVSGQIVAASFPAMALPPEESVVLSLPEIRVPEDSALADSPIPVSADPDAASKPGIGDSGAEPRTSRSRSRSRTLWVAAASFVAGVALTWSVGLIRGTSTQSTSVTQPDKVAAPVPPAPTPVAATSTSSIPSASPPPGTSPSTPSEVAPSVASAAGAPVAEPAAASAAVSSSDSGTARTRLARAAGARATPERGHRPWPPHQKTARPAGWTQPRANAAGVSVSRGKAKIDARPVDPFDDASTAPRPVPRATPAARSARPAKGFVDPFGD